MGLMWLFQKQQTRQTKPVWAAAYDDEEMVYQNHGDYAVDHAPGPALRIATTLAINYAARRCQIGRIHIKPKAN